MSETVTGKFKSGIIWNSIEKIFVQGTSFVIGVILARLLDPSDFGLIGMLGVFIALSNTLVDSGMSNALIQKHNCTDKDYSTVFVMNMIMSVIIYVILYFLAPSISSFYNEPLLCDLTRVLGLQFVLSAVNIVHRAKLTINTDFKSLAIINVISSLISGITGVILAYAGLGVWALVLQSISSIVVSMILFPFYSKWKPSFRFSGNSFKPLFSYSWKLVVTGIYSTIINNVYTIVIGKFYNSKDLGYYSKGSSAPTTFSNVIYSILGGVSFPVMSSIKEDRERMLNIYKKSLFMTALLVFPFMSLLATLSRPLVCVLYTEKWLPCVFVMQMFCLSRIFTPLSAINISILNASGRSDLFMKMDFSKLPLTILTMCITLPLGINAMAIGSLLETFICFFINCYFPGKLYKYSAWEQIKDWRYILLSALVMNAAVFFLMRLFCNPWLQIFVCGTIGGCIYLFCCFVFKIVNKQVLIDIINQRFKWKKWKKY